MKRSSMSNRSLPRRVVTQAHRVAGPVLTPTQRPGPLAAFERALQRVRHSLGAGSFWHMVRRARPWLDAGASLR